MKDKNLPPLPEGFLDEVQKDIDDREEAELIIRKDCDATSLGYPRQKKGRYDKNKRHGDLHR